MNNVDQTQASASSDDLMIDALRACGFFARTSGLLEGQRPQILGSLDNAIAFFKLTVAGADTGIVTAFAPYLKQGETPLQRLEREIKDSATLAAMLGDERAKSIAVPHIAKAIATKLVEIHDALCNHIGDTDPQIDPDMSDEEVCEEYPVFWAAMQVALLLGSGPWREGNSTVAMGEKVHPV